MHPTQRLYNAERDTSVFYARPLESPQETHRIVCHLRETPEWKARYSTQRKLGLIFTETPKEYDACFFFPTLIQWKQGWGGHIDMTPTGRTLGVLAHELSHFVIAERVLNGEDTGEPHGWQFARTYLHMVWILMGKSRAEELAHAFVKHGVNWTN